MGQPALTLFFSYSHKDEPLRDELEKHLKILEREKIISNWHDHKILLGEEWDHQIDDNLRKADIILLLISADFIASEYCWDIEIKVAMERHNAGEVVVIPVILRPVNWKNAPFGKLQFLPKDAAPITSWKNQDEAFLNVSQGIQRSATDLMTKRQQKEQEAKKKASLNQYHQKVQELVINGQISFAAQLILKDLQTEVGLSDIEVETIETAVLKPYQDYQKNLDKYKKAFTHYAAQQYPLTQAAIDDLKQLETYYKLQPSDLEKIVIEFEQQQSENRFFFDIITVNSRGEEISRTTGTAEYFKETLGNNFILEMVSIPGGSFWMGTDNPEIERLCKQYDTDWFRNEKPQHQVTVSLFFMGKYPITQKQWQAIAVLDKVNIDLNPNPSHFTGDNRPVECVNWYEAVEFCQRLSRETGKDYQLPSEAQWEYACRSVNSYQLSVISEELAIEEWNQKYNLPFYRGETITTDLANYDGNYVYADEPKGQYRQETTPVGQFSPNAFGLYDMHGNVWQWCLDDYHANYQGAPRDGSAWTSSDNDTTKILRGGSCNYIPNACRCAFRNLYGLPRDYLSNVGVRVVCAPPRTF
ncbi:protein of unknown function DUF323 [Rippkaea orientalis PCC 8801]|uniref:TIR domain-containing protein n=1 Tax=Rippkaea orientalis (strain PCC 8801 / RF-1) TaxID=41431 RepID=B7K3U9_RIPO1|nr:SUMF1/EgtB/PvdO family nonheme iron enzyme [Rippkaea orientalis]ACK66489.1 protein of unknown function DUF323 [Rippkaea orientalis PCC 8801]